MKTLARLAALLFRSRTIETRLDALRALIDQRIDGDRQPGRKLMLATPRSQSGGSIVACCAVSSNGGKHDARAKTLLNVELKGGNGIAQNAGNRRLRNYAAEPRTAYRLDNSTSADMPRPLCSFQIISIVRGRRRLSLFGNASAGTTKIGFSIPAL